ncbi:MAG: hypothetical protein R2811_07670 [Flavobacteriales bacterium]
MSAPNAFDEQARRKLAEREHPFDEAAWTAMQPALDAQQMDRRKRRLLLWIPFLVGIGVATWWFTREQETSTVASVRPEATEQQATAPEVKPALEIEEPLVEGATTKTTVSNDPISTNVQPSPVVQGKKEASITEKHGTHPHQRTSIASTKSMDEKPAIAATVVPPPGTNTATSVADPIEPVVVVPGSTIPSSATTSPDEDHISSEEVVVIHNVEPDLPVVATEPTLEFKPVAERVDPPAVAPDRALAEGELPAPVITRDTVPLVAANDSSDYAADTPAAVDSNLTAAMAARKLEVSVWGGLFRSTTDYSGDLTTDWASRVSSAGSSAFGVELMHQGRYFGYGSGLHFTSYVEQLESDRLQEESRRTVTDHYLDPVDTTILIVNGTVWLNGQQYYVTQMLDTTIYVLVTTTSEEVSTSVRRNALTRSNRVSYLEIPLLFDAHLRRGNWSFGLRGGPMLGILQGRRGALPTANGYTDLTDEAFTELVLGWSLQGHIRYHLGDYWSVAIGPAMRGQLQNTVQTTGLDRRSNAAGAVLSVGYFLQ